MNSSGIKRGLAVTAVAALASVGLPLAAHADNVDDQVSTASGGAADVVLYSQDSGVATVKSDGTNSSIRLEAGATGDISAVTFQFKRAFDAGWTNITTVPRNDNGAFSFEWTPSGAVFENAGGVEQTTAAIDIKVLGQPAGGGGIVEEVKAIMIEKAAGPTDAVNLADGNEIGVYQRTWGAVGDFVAVSGTINEGAGATTVDLLDGAGATAATTGAIPATTTPATDVAKDTFSGVLDIAGAYTYDAPDEIVLAATNGSDDVESYSLYKQVVTTVTATPKVANPATAATDTDVVVTVLDQNGKPIAGANVQSSEDGDLGQTNSKGQLTVPPQQNVNDGTVTYTVNTTANLAFQPELGDKRVQLTLGVGFASSLVAETPEDETSFDRDELAGGFDVQVKDQGGADFDIPNTQDLTYYWRITPFNTATPPSRSADVTVDDAAGEYPVMLPAGPSGTYELYGSVNEGGTGHPIAETKIATLKVGQAKVEYELDETRAPNNTTATVNGTLELEDGTPLVGRNIALTYFAGTEYNQDGSVGTADAALVSNLVPETGAGGAFSADIKDIALNDESEIGGVLNADSAAGDFADWNGGAGYNHPVVFFTDQLPANAVISVDYTYGGGNPSPLAGEYSDVEILVEDEFGRDIVGVAVDLELPGDGFFTDGDADPVVGNYAPTPNDLGKTMTVVTDAAGEAAALATVGRSEGFDDDGRYTDEVTATADGVTGSDSLQYISGRADLDNTGVDESIAPLGVSKVEIVETPGQNLPDPVPTGVDFSFDVFAWDQFGNRAAGVEIEVGCAVGLGADDECPTDTSFGNIDSDNDDGGDFTVSANEGGDFTFTAVAETEKYRTVGGATETVEVTDQFTKSFYDVVPTTFTLDAPATLPVNSTALVTANVVDQDGNPVAGIQVDFVRTGDPNESRFSTDANGNAVYAFRGTEAGTEVVTAVFRTTPLVVGGPSTVLDTQTVEIVFEADVEEVTATLTGGNAGKKKDRVSVGTNAADGTIVKFQRKVKGSWKPAGSRVVSNGKAAKKVKDRNGKKRTAYRAKVMDAAGTVITNVKKIR